MTRFSVPTALHGGRWLATLACIVIPIVSGFAQEQHERFVQLRGASEETRTDLRREVADEIKRLESGDGRAADVADIAYTMEQHLRGNGFARAAVEYRMFRVATDGTAEPVRTASGWPDVRNIEFQISPGKQTFFRHDILHRELLFHRRTPSRTASDRGYASFRVAGFRLNSADFEAPSGVLRICTRSTALPTYR